MVDWDWKGSVFAVLVTMTTLFLVQNGVFDPLYERINRLIDRWKP